MMKTRTLPSSTLELQRFRTDWVIKGMRLKPDTLELYDIIKKNERFSDNEMLEFLFSALLYLKNDNVKFRGLSEGEKRKDMFDEIAAVYEK